MNPSPAQGLTVATVRVDQARLRLGQTIVPVALIFRTLAKHFPSLVIDAVGLVILAVGVVTIFSARRRLGRQSLRPHVEKLSVGDASPEISSATVSRWTFDRGIARLQGGQVSWQLRAETEDGDELRATLERVIGPPLSLTRRGTPRARIIALSCAAAGVAIVVVGIRSDTVVVAGIGTIATIMGIATFGAFSQRVGRPDAS
jgi:hypothetical protein